MSTEILISLLEKITLSEWETGPKQHTHTKTLTFINVEVLTHSRYVIGISPATSKNHYDQVAFFPLEPENILKDEAQGVHFKETRWDFGDNVVGTTSGRRQNVRFNFREDDYNGADMLGANEEDVNILDPNAIIQHDLNDNMLTHGLSNHISDFLKLPIDHNGMPYRPAAGGEQEEEKKEEAPHEVVIQEEV
jgi:hypothetical protein